MPNNTDYLLSFPPLNYMDNIRFGFLASRDMQTAYQYSCFNIIENRK